MLLRLALKSQGMQVQPLLRGGCIQEIQYVASDSLVLIASLKVIRGKYQLSAKFFLSLIEAPLIWRLVRCAKALGARSLEDEQLLKAALDNYHVAALRVDAHKCVAVLEAR